MQDFSKCVLCGDCVQLVCNHQIYLLSTQAIINQNIRSLTYSWFPTHLNCCCCNRRPVSSSFVVLIKREIPFTSIFIGLSNNLSDFTANKKRSNSLFVPYYSWDVIKQIVGIFLTYSLMYAAHMWRCVRLYGSRCAGKFQHLQAF